MARKTILDMLSGGGVDYGPILSIGAQAQQTGETLATGAEQGGTPFQKALQASYKKDATANWNSYAAEFAAAGGSPGALDTGTLTNEEAQKLGLEFTQSDYENGLKALGLAGESFTRAAGIGLQQNAQTMQAAGSLGSAIAAIFA